MSDPRHTLGLAAEAATERWLTDAGWRVLARRLRLPGSCEVDLAAIDPRGFLVAVEVRARGSPRAGSAAASVDERHVRRLRHSLAAIGATVRCRHRGLRVDLVTAEPAEAEAEAGAGRWRLVRIPGIG